MNAPALLANFRSRKIRIIPDGDSSIVEPASKLTTADREAIRQHKTSPLAFFSETEILSNNILRHCKASETKTSTDPERHLKLYAIAEESRSASWTPAHSIIATCERHGVLLRIDPANGDLVVGRTKANGYEPSQPWGSLIC